jgi:hypothetical protein
MKRLIFILLILLSVVATQSFAQKNNRRIYLGLGFGALSGLSVSPYISKYNQNDFNVTLGTAYLEVNTLLKVINQNNSFSFNTAPGINLSLGIMGVGSVCMPMTINYNIGALATTNSDKRIGFTFGIGAFIQSTSWIALPSGNDNYNTPVQPLNTMYLYTMPCVQTGFRFLKESRAAYDMILQVGAWSYKPEQYSYNYSSSSPNPISQSPIPNNAFFIRITMVRYLNFKKKST